MEYTIEKMEDKDWDAVEAIYLEGIVTANATFETESPGWENWNKNHLRICRLVAKENSQIIGWAALSPVSSRCVYSGVAEVSIYVSSSKRGKGVGKSLLQALIEDSEREGIWTLQGGVFPENIASIALCKTCGFREVGSRERISQSNGVWRNVVLLERRSKVVEDKK